MPTFPKLLIACATTLTLTACIHTADTIVGKVKVGSKSYDVFETRTFVSGRETGLIYRVLIETGVLINCAENSFESCRQAARAYLQSRERVPVTLEEDSLPH
ncbi:MAG: hypothetical protein AB3N23_15905 [Paracoccaceae bacterium]